MGAITGVFQSTRPMAAGIVARRDRSRKSHRGSLSKAIQVLDAAWRGRGAAHPNEPTLLEHADRCDVVHRNERVERAREIVAQELRECRGRDPAPPVLAANPVPDHAPLFLRPAPDVTRDPVVPYDRL